MPQIFVVISFRLSLSPPHLQHWSLTVLWGEPDLGHTELPSPLVSGRALTRGAWRRHAAQHSEGSVVGGLLFLPHSYGVWAVSAQTLLQELRLWTWGYLAMKDFRFCEKVKSSWAKWESEILTDWDLGSVWTKYLCPPPTHHYQILMWKAYPSMVFGVTRIRWDQEGGALMNGILTGVRVCSLSALCCVRTEVTVGSLPPVRGLLSESNHAGILILDFHPPQWREKNFCCL